MPWQVVTEADDYDNKLFIILEGRLEYFVQVPTLFDLPAISTRGFLPLRLPPSYKLHVDVSVKDAIFSILVTTHHFDNAQTKIELHSPLNYISH